MKQGIPWLCGRCRAWVQAGEEHDCQPKPAAPRIKACPWGGCNGTGPAGGYCNRCGTPVDFPYVRKDPAPCYPSPCCGAESRPVPGESVNLKACTRCGKRWTP